MVDLGSVATPYVQGGFITSIDDIAFYRQHPYSENPEEYDGTWLQGELWRTDGTKKGTVRITDNLASPEGAVFGGRLYFITRGNGGWYLARTTADSTAAEEVAFLLPDLPGTSALLNRRAKLTVGTSRLFVGLEIDQDSGESNFSLWSSRGTPESTVHFADSHLDTYDDGARIESMFVHGDTLYFSNSSEEKVELWRSDGTESGTEFFADLSSWHASRFLRARAGLSFGGALWFSSDSSNIEASDRQLFRSDGTHGIEPVMAGFPENSQPRHFITLDNGTTLFGTKRYIQVNPPEDLTVKVENVFATKGTAVSTVEIIHNTPCFDCEAHDSYPPYPDNLQMLSLGNKAFVLRADAGVLWKTDGSEQGTSIIKDLHTRNPDSFSLAPVGSKSAVMLGKIQNPSVSLPSWDPRVPRLWNVDGSDTGIRRLDTWRSYQQLGSPITHKNRVYFDATNEELGTALWRTDGTKAGTSLIKYIRSGVDGSNKPGISNLTSAGRHIYFTYYESHNDGNDSTSGNEYLATLDSTTSTIKTIVKLPVPLSSYRNFTSVRDSLFFFSDAGLYTSNGKPGNLRNLGYFELGPQAIDGSAYEGSVPMIAFRNRLYFVARKNSHDPMHVWRVGCGDATPEMITPEFTLPVPAGESFKPTMGFYIHDNRLFLTVMDHTDDSGGIFELRQRGGQLDWYQHTNKSATALSIGGGRMYFASADDEYGEEPWSMALPPRP